MHKSPKKGGENTLVRDIFKKDLLKSTYSKHKPYKKMPQNQVTLC